MSRVSHNVLYQRQRLLPNEEKKGHSYANHWEANNKWKKHNITTFFFFGNFNYLLENQRSTAEEGMDFQKKSKKPGSICPILV